MHVLTSISSPTLHFSKQPHLGKQILMFIEALGLCIVIIIIFTAEGDKNVNYVLQYDIYTHTDVLGTLTVKVHAHFMC
jgi:hypothetical protein